MSRPYITTIACAVVALPLSTSVDAQFGGFASHQHYLLPGGTVHVAVGDLNNNGVLDLVVSRSSGGVALLFGNGDGSFGAPQMISLPGGSAYRAVVSDFDEDGNSDIAVTMLSPAALYVLFGNGDRTFRAAEFITSEGGGYRLEAADLNADGHFDLVSRL